MTVYTKDRIEKASRIYRDNAQAGRALGIAASSFSRLCRRYGIETPAQRRQRQQHERRAD